MRPARCRLAVLAMAAFSSVDARAQADVGRIIAPAPESADAEGRGHADVAAAQRLARGGRIEDATAMLERVAHEFPAAVHDCNLALAYLRQGDLTRAQLWHDLATVRGTTPPAWCRDTLTVDLAVALRAHGLVPLTLTVAPAAAVVEVAGLRLRELGRLWLVPGTYTVIARAPGMAGTTLQVAVGAPSTQAAITLAAEPSGGNRPAPTVAAAPAVAAAVPHDPAPASAAVTKRAPPPRRPTPRVLAAAGASSALLAIGAVLHVRALATRARADQLVAGTDEFGAARARFGSQRTLAVGSYVAGATLGAVAGWWWARDRRRGRARLGVDVARDRALVVAAWTWSAP